MQLKSARNRLVLKYRRFFLKASKIVGGKHQLVGRCNQFLALSLVSCVGPLVLSIPGCASSPAVPSISEDVRAFLGTIGVQAVGPTLDGIVTGPIGSGAEAGRVALKGSGVGGLTGAGTGAVLGLTTGPCAPVAVPVFALMGAGGGLIIGGGAGAIYGAVTAIPEEQAEEISSHLSEVLSAHETRARMRERLASQIEVRSVSNVVELSAQDAYESSGVDTVLETSVEQVSFAAERGDDPELSLVILASARVIKFPENEVVWSEEEIAFVSEPRGYSSWRDTEGSIEAEIEAGLDAIAAQLAELLFPGTEI